MANASTPSAHTPAPWIAEDYPEYIAICGRDCGTRIADVYAAPTTEEDQEAKADARLIAAAPELLDALKSLVESVESDMEANFEHQTSDCGGSENCTLCEAKETISKARGE